MKLPRRAVESPFSFRQLEDLTEASVSEGVDKPGDGRETETHPMHRPANTSRTVCVLSLFPFAATTAKRTPQTTKQPMLYIQ